MIETDCRHHNYFSNRLIACNLKFYFGPSSAYRLDDLFEPEFFAQRYLSVEQQHYHRRITMGEMVDEYPELEATARVATTSANADSGCSAVDVEQTKCCSQQMNAAAANRYNPPSSVAPLAPLSANQVHSMIDDFFTMATDEKIQLVATSQYLSVDGRFGELSANEGCCDLAGGSSDGGACVECDEMSSTCSLVDASSQQTVSSSPQPLQLDQLTCCRRESSLTASSRRSDVGAEECGGACQLEPVTAVSSAGCPLSGAEEAASDCESTTASSTWKSAPNRELRASSGESSPVRTGKLLSSLRLVTESLARHSSSSSPVEAGIMIWQMKDPQQQQPPRNGRGNRRGVATAAADSAARAYAADCVGDWRTNRPKRKTATKVKVPEQQGEMPLWIGGLKRVDSLTNSVAKAKTAPASAATKPTKRDARAPRWSIGRQLCKRCCPSDCVDALKSVYKRLRKV
ncbi:hypothetical protein V9T40_007349 [Parthenolecanium corni]|uniref:Uncharacterized protein n=1 Tax=Parthenolecanium corni TaxID=536013 RepID=A0AAN9TY94_9HEMI